MHYKDAHKDLVKNIPILINWSALHYTENTVKCMLYHHSALSLILNEKMQ